MKNLKVTNQNTTTSEDYLKGFKEGYAKGFKDAWDTLSNQKQDTSSKKPTVLTETVDTKNVRWLGPYLPE